MRLEIRALAEKQNCWNKALFEMARAKEVGGCVGRSVAASRVFCDCLPCEALRVKAGHFSWVWVVNGIKLSSIFVLNLSVPSIYKLGCTVLNGEPMGKFRTYPGRVRQCRVGLLASSKLRHLPSC